MQVRKGLIRALQHRALIGAALLILAPVAAFAQLEFIPPVTVETSSAIEPGGILLLTTRDNHYLYGAANKFASSLQIVDPARPWPPLFFVNAATGPSMGINEKIIFQDARFQDAARLLTFFYGVSGKGKESISAYIIADTNFSVTDTFYGSKGHITGHGFEINRQGEKLYYANEDTVLNLTALTGLASDSAVPVDIQHIEIADKNDSIIFIWNPVEHLPLSDTYAKLHEIGESNPFTKGWNWSRGTSLRFSSDGNMVYSLRYMGLGKVSRQSGELLWKLGGKTPTIPLPAGGDYYRQHDFQEREPGIYSVFSNGDEEHACKQILFKIDEKNKTAEILRIIEPVPAVFSTHGGNFELIGKDRYLLNMGNNAALGERNRVFFIADTSGNKVADYSLPCLNHAFQVHLVSSWKPRQPPILSHGNRLSVDSGAESVLWYRIESHHAVPVGEGQFYTPEKKGAYVAVTKKGFGWIVSKTYIY